MTQVLENPVLISDFVWTLDRYHEAIAAGILGPEDKLELLNGKLVKKMSINPPHAACVTRVNKFFIRKYFDQYEVRSENPVTFLDDNEPEPDIAICDLDDNDYAQRHPSAAEVHLVIEVSDRSLYRDRMHKASIYARAGIKEYWIINLKNRQVEVHTAPDIEDGSYGNINRHKAGTTLQSDFVGTIEVDSLLFPK